MTNENTKKSRKGEVRLIFDHTEALITLLWEEVIDGFADAGFGENAEILVAMQSRLGLGGICQLVVALRQQEAEPLQQLCDLVTQQERRTSPDCYNRLIVRRAAQGALVIVVDQPGNLDYLPPLVPPGNQLQFHTTSLAEQDSVDHVESLSAVVALDASPAGVPVAATTPTQNRNPARGSPKGGRGLCGKLQ